ncbi:hypothetical protein CERSUDRAFT_75984 [Gelatoporia subvermispora B]|uniref:Uncharacterized protein n=1 Tax=Ceriporiopsis subvermispora (strain B) TaxID=914234 RepID=M2QBV6_CERS8|nr:hypothetical protein CERSUDRAFT_75984 [Gelatoporia subvermispora B]
MADNDPISIEDILTTVSQRWPTFPFTEQHLEVNTKWLKVLHPRRFNVPVLIGPTLPRPDREKELPRYSHLMLMFFKPWRSSSDLRTTGQSWHAAFETFLPTVTDYAKSVLMNMQIMNECHDSWVAHLRKGGHCHHLRGEPPTTAGGGVAIDIDTAERHNLSDVIDHLETVDRCKSSYMSRIDTGVLECISAADSLNLFSQFALSCHGISAGCESEVAKEDTGSLEAGWRLEYGECRARARARMAEQPEPGDAMSLALAVGMAPQALDATMLAE